MLEESMMQPLRGKGENRGKAQERLPSIQTRIIHPTCTRFGTHPLEDREMHRR